MKKVLIVGAGYAGIETALTLSKKKKKDDLEITIIDKNSYHTLLTELHEVAGNRVPEEAIRIPLKRVFEYTTVKTVVDEIKEFNFSENKLKSESKEYSYDYLVLALGSTPNFYGIEGLKEYAFTLWSYDDAIKIREHIKNCFLLASQEEDEEKRRQLLTFVVGGAGFTGVEMIGELAHWVRLLRREYKIKKEEISLKLVDALPNILSTLNEKSAKKTLRYLEKKLGVEVILSTAISGVNAEGFNISSGHIATKTLIWAAGVRSALDVENIDIEKVANSRRLKVDNFGKTEHKNVYSIGDVSALSNEKGEMYPAMVETAVQSGHGAALNILNDIRGKEQKEIKVKMHGVMVSVGNYFAVGELMGKVLPVWLAIVMKYFVNIHYLWELTGFYGVARYLYHEVLERRQRKLFVEKHWSTRVQAWWLTPLRVFLGGVWIAEAVKKIGEGWLSTPQLQKFMGATLDITSNADKVKDYFSLDLWLFKFGFYAEKIKIAADTTTGATSATAPPTDAASNAANSATAVVQSFGDTFFKIDFPLITWFVKQFTLTDNNSQMFFQWFIIISEILVGAAIIAGCFTFIFTAFSLFLNFNFMCTTGIYDKTWWMVFAAIAIMAGAGRAFGLDYYVIPYFNNLWERIWKSRRFSLAFERSLDRHE